jgi:hypothetical protein
LFFEDEKATSHNAAELMRRACQIANLTGWRNADTSPLKALIQEITQAAFDDRDASGYFNIGELNVDYEFSELLTITTQAETLAVTEGIHPDTRSAAIALRSNPSLN